MNSYSGLRRLGAWMQGHYTCKCSCCDMMFVGDKSATNCLPCAVKAYESHIRRLAEALKSAAECFRQYEQDHLAKGTRKERMKADRNADMAELCESALTPWVTQAMEKPA